jgi:preprotein translocase subunit SecE
MLEFFKGVKTELQKVVWPTWRETARYTGTVIAFSVVVSLILGAADLGLIELFGRLLGR